MTYCYILPLRDAFHYCFLFFFFSKMSRSILKNPITGIYVFSTDLTCTYSNKWRHRALAEHLQVWIRPQSIFRASWGWSFVPVLSSSIHLEKHYQQHFIDMLCVHNKSFFVLFILAAMCSSLLRKKHEPEQWSDRVSKPIEVVIQHMNSEQAIRYIYRVFPKCNLLMSSHYMVGWTWKIIFRWI
jgi:hypothetical protein